MQFSPQQLDDIVSEIMEKMRQEDGGAVKPKPAAAVMDEQQSALGMGGNEPFDYEYGAIDPSGNSYYTPYESVTKLINRVLHTDSYVVADRAILATKAHQMFSNDSGITRAAKMLAYLLRHLPIKIYDDELIVGDIGAPSRCAPIFPEFSYSWIMDELREGVWNKRNNDVFHVTEKDKEALLSVEEYWKGKTNSEYIINLLSDDEKKGSSLYPKPVFFPNLPLYGGIGHIIPRFQKVLEVGHIGLKREIVECMAKLDTSNPANVEKREFYVAGLIVLEGLKEYYCRWGSLAREMASKEKSAKRKAELIRIAENMEWISENPPRDFYEALQFYLMIGAITYIESGAQGTSWGRTDQILYPYYEKDMREGKITKQYVGELIEHFYVKLHEMVRLRDDETARLNSEIGIGGTIVLLGGCDESGKDITNDLSFICLEGHAHTRLPDPWLACRWSMTAPWEFKVKTVNTIRIGTGQPKLYLDECVIPNCMRAGRSLEHSRNYSMVGCVEVDSGGFEYGSHDASYFSLAKVLELAINNGRCVDCNPNCPRAQKCAKAGGLGPNTGSLETFKSFDEVKQAYKTQMEYWVKRMVAFYNACEVAHARNQPVPYASIINACCIQSGKDLSAGGALYNFAGVQGIGVGTVADSLSSIKQLIFEEKRVNPKDLLDALKNNWVGYEPLLALVNSDQVHHFGNDDDYADDLARFATDTYCNEVDKYRNYRGGRYQPGLWSVSANVGIGLVQGATPDGRSAHEALSNCMGPVQTKMGGHDVNGPTAVIRSAAKCDHVRATNGTLLNVRFSPSCVSGMTGRDNFISYIDEYCTKKGYHMQFNVISTETLVDAQKHPERYPTLMVRVAGYSAFFTRLSRELQDDLIGRSAYDAFD